MYLVEGGTHNDSWIVGGEVYKERLTGFMNEGSLIMDKVRDYQVKMSDTTKVASKNS